MIFYKMHLLRVGKESKVNSLLFLHEECISNTTLGNSTKEFKMYLSNVGKEELSNSSTLFYNL